MRPNSDQSGVLGPQGACRYKLLHFIHPAFSLAIRFYGSCCVWARHLSSNQDFVFVCGVEALPILKTQPCGWPKFGSLLAALPPADGKEILSGSPHVLALWLESVMPQRSSHCGSARSGARRRRGG